MRRRTFSPIPLVLLFIAVMIGGGAVAGMPGRLDVMGTLSVDLSDYEFFADITPIELIQKCECDCYDECCRCYDEHDFEEGSGNDYEDGYEDYEYEDYDIIVGSYDNDDGCSNGHEYNNGYDYAYGNGYEYSSGYEHNSGYEYSNDNGRDCNDGHGDPSYSNACNDAYI